MRLADEEFLGSRRVSDWFPPRCIFGAGAALTNVRDRWNAGHHQGRPAMGQIGEPIRRYTVIPLEEPVSPTPELVTPPPPSKAPNSAPPVTKPEPEPVE